MNWAALLGKSTLTRMALNKPCKKRMTAMSESEGAFSRLGSACVAASNVIGAAMLAVGAAVGGAFVGGLAATMNWGEQIEMLTKLLGMSGDEAAGFAGAMNYVGVSVEEGTGGLSIFVKNLNASRLLMEQAAAHYTDSMQALTRAHAAAVDSSKPAFWRRARCGGARTRNLARPRRKKESIERWSARTHRRHAGEQSGTLYQRARTKSIST